MRLGAISFVNTVPIYSDYRPASGIDLVYDVPAALNAAILSGKLEVSPVSSACYLRNQDKLILLEDLSVSSPGAVESVIFLSRKPLGAGVLDYPAINVPNDSETSVALLAYLLKEATGEDLRPWFKIYEAADYKKTLEESGNALVIGDNALMVQESGLASDCYVYDLSTLWKERTGLPFVFAVWVADRRWADKNPGALAEVTRELRAARDRFFADTTVFEQGIALAQTKSSLPRETLERYYRQCLSYGLSPEHQTSLARFEQIIQSFDQPGNDPDNRGIAYAGQSD